MADARIVETFNTHRMSDAVVRAVAIGRDDELAEIVPAIRRAALAPEQPPQALIVYGERGSGKSFLMRLVQIECAAIDGVACVLLPEEQYNIRAPHQLLDVVAAHVRGDDWSAMGWQIDARAPEQAWDESLAALHAALDARFGAGRGMAVVLLENFDTLAEKLFGASAPAKSAKGRGAPARGQAVARRQAEERLRKLMGARGGRFMLIASATGTVDMDYERPLFQAFKPVDLQSWTSDTAIGYFNKRRALDSLPALSTEQEARARAIIEFIGGNARLTQLLGTVLASPSAHTIADTLDQLVDQLADYYRQRLDALPPAAAGVLDALIRGGEPVSQTALAQRVGGQQSQIADAFSYLTRARLVQAASERGGASQLYRVRDRLFVHFYRRRYGGSRGLAPIAELLERFFTPQEREEQIRSHLERGEFEDARAFGRLPLVEGPPSEAYCRYRDGGIVDTPVSEWFGLAGVDDADLEALRIELRDEPDHAFKRWAEGARNAPDEARRAAAWNLQAIAASRNGHDRIAQRILDDGLTATEAGQDPAARALALSGAGMFAWYRAKDRPRARRHFGALAELLPRLGTGTAFIVAADYAAFAAREEGRKLEAEAIARSGLAAADSPRLRTRLLYTLAWVLKELGRVQESLAAFEDMRSLARSGGSVPREIDALAGLALVLIDQHRYRESIEISRRAEALARAHGFTEFEISAAYRIAVAENRLGEHDAARADANRGLSLALAQEPPLLAGAAWCTYLESFVLRAIATAEALRDAVSASARSFDFAQRSGDPEVLAAAADELLYVATRVAIPGTLARIAHLFDEGRIPNWTNTQLEATMTCAARTDEWALLEDILRRHPPRMEHRRPTMSLFGTGQFWAEVGQLQGRAAAFAKAADTLPRLAAILAALPLAPGEQPDSRRGIEIGSLAGGLSKDCPDAGLLRDVATLLEERFGPAVAESVTQLRAFADFHAADDKEAHLQRIDPDLATAIRRVWDLPEPRDTLALRGRKRAR